MIVFIQSPSRRCFQSLFGWILVLTFGFGLLAVPAQAQEFHYRYVSLNEVELPAGFFAFDPIKITNSGRIYGVTYGPFGDSTLPHVAVYSAGTISVLRPGLVNVVNEHGTAGGSVVVDLEFFIEQAALFDAGEVELIPPQPGEIFSRVIALNDSRTALVESIDDSFQQIFLLYKNGLSTQVDFGLTSHSTFLSINNQGTIAGTTILPGLSRGFRFNSQSGELTQLEPLSTEPESWAQAINNRGEVLGYSFFPGGLERIGIWQRDGAFQTYFVEGVPEFPTLSNQLLFNDNNLIVITRTFSGDRKSYLLPEPGVRLNLADLVVNLPSDEGVLYHIRDLNNHGDMIGADFFLGNSFLLERVGVEAP